MSTLLLIIWLIFVILIALYLIAEMVVLLVTYFKLGEPMRIGEYISLSEEKEKEMRKRK
jgi:hypothetical protein